MTTGFIMLTLIYVISMEFLPAETQSFLLPKRLQRGGARRNGVFAGYRVVNFFNIANDEGPQ